MVVLHVSRSAFFFKRRNGWRVVVCLCCVWGEREVWLLESWTSSLSLSAAALLLLLCERPEELAGRARFAICTCGCSTAFAQCSALSVEGAVIGSTCLMPDHLSAIA